MQDLSGEDEGFIMSNDFWNQQQQQNGKYPPQNNGYSPSQNNGVPRSGSLLRDYRQQGLQQANPSPQYNSPISPMPPTPQGQAWPTGQSCPSSGWVATTVQTVRRWS